MFLVLSDYDILCDACIVINTFKINYKNICNYNSKKCVSIFLNVRHIPYHYEMQFIVMEI